MCVRVCVCVPTAEMKTAALDAGGLPVCEKARVRFAQDPKVQQNAVFAVNNMVAEDESHVAASGGITSSISSSIAACTMQ